MIARYCVTALFLLTFEVGAITAQKTTSKHDGYWWTNSDQSFKLGFVSGYVMAMNGINDRDVFRCIAQKSGGKLPATYPGRAMVEECSETEEAKMTDFSGFMVGQWADGIDEFYKDFRNKSLDVDLALKYVRDQLNGKPAKELEDEVTKMRQYAAGK